MEMQGLRVTAGWFLTPEAETSAAVVSKKDGCAPAPTSLLKVKRIKDEVFSKLQQ